MPELPQYLENLKPSENAARALSHLARQIAKRDDILEKDVLGQEEILEICSREKLGRKDKLKNIRAFLEKQRYPEKAKIEKELNECLEKIRKEHSLKLNLPKELEGDSLDFSFSFKNPSELKEFSRKIEKLSEDRNLEEIFDILTGES